ncbi:hypothetical protein FRC12_000459 [Ceratobasidium sp. 428]|nr:hypothetical protein FRC12_000459 [Ceratobasidium sp. 428]
MSGEKKRGFKDGFERGLKRFRLSPSSSSSSPGPSAHSIQQTDTTHMPETDPQHSMDQAGPSCPLHTVPPPKVELSDNTPNPLPASISPVPPTAEQGTKRERWAQLVALSKVLAKGFRSFGPLKQAVEAIEEAVETFEAVDQNREDYEQLRKDLNKMFHDLAEFFDASTPRVMAPAIVNFAQGIDQELDIVRRRLSKTSIGAHATDADKIIGHYRRIQTLLQQLTSNVGFKTLEVADEQATESRLKSLPHSSAAKYSSAESSDLRGRCTQNTRVELLEDIYEWACNDKSQKIYWLNGMAGTGKTTIAYSFCERLEDSRKLAASFFCSRQLPSCRDVNRIVPTVSYQLSRFSRLFRSALSEVLKDNPDVHNQVLREQFKSMVLNPLEYVKDALRTDLVVVIDALDECDNNDGVDRMLSALLSSAQRLPIKFFVASRPDAKILDRMRGQRGESMPTELRLHELGRSIVQEDVRTYLNAQLMSHMSLSTNNLDILVERSGVLFIYASTAARYIGYDNFSRAGSRLKKILGLTKDSSSDSEKDINALYGVILAAAFDDSKLASQDREEMKLVLHTVICAREPLSVDVMAGLLELDFETVWAALRPLFSVLHVLDGTQIITTLHESFPDYLVNRDRSGVFHCDVKEHNRQLAQLCFEQIKLPNPPFNICNLDSSYVLDEDVPDLPARVEKAISKQLLYACRYWAAHYMSAEGSQNLASMLREFASERFLLWMEVMNLSGKIEEGVSTLDLVQEWSSSTKYLDEGIRRFLQDMWKFADSFASSEVRRSTPHIYVSTLTFWPGHTPISDHYRQHQGYLITGRSTAVVPRKLAAVAIPRHLGKNILEEYMPSEEFILCASYSPDGAYIVSGSKYGVIRIWDAHTGHPVGQPLLGHRLSVSSVAYSPDGACIVSGSDDSTIRIWDAQTGQLVRQPLQGHQWFVSSVAYSPDGAYIVTSGLYDRTIRIWDTRTSQPVGQPLEARASPRFVVYSPDGAYIVSGCGDSTIRIWDAHTRRPVGQPLEGHTGVIDSVAYSPDGAYIASGSWDKTIRIWDAHTRQPVRQPLEGHTDFVSSVAYSPDGAYIVSGSWDKTIRIWDAHTSQPVGQPLRGHTHKVISVAYSPAGIYIVSGSYDDTIRVWDMNLALLMNDASEIDNSQPHLAHSLRAISEPRILCNLGCHINCPHMAWTLNHDGWIIFNGNRLIWIPDDLRVTLLRPQNTALMSTAGFLQLDLNRNKLGEHWHKNFQPGKSIAL